ncbi:MAG: galactokinase family protein, partial [Clostridia bacterium]|nr:galactokinase family protein [Clostridia bacterium]
MTTAEWKAVVNSDGFYDKVRPLYVDETKLEAQRARYLHALDEFEKLFGDGPVELFSAPGRSEVGGNHTDHQRGKVLACSLNLDVIAVVRKRVDGVIT